MFVTLHTNVIVVTIRISTVDLIGGGGNTDVCPGRRTPSRRHWIWNKITSLLPYTYSIYPRRPISVTFMSCQTDSYFSPNITPRAHRTIYATFPPITSHADFHKKSFTTERGKFNECFTTNLLLSLTMKEFWKSVKIRRNYSKRKCRVFELDTTSSLSVIRQHASKTSSSYENVSSPCGTKLLDHR